VYLKKLSANFQEATEECSEAIEKRLDVKEKLLEASINV